MYLNSAGIYLFKLSNGISRFHIVKSVQNYCKLWDDFTRCSDVFIVVFEQVNVAYITFYSLLIHIFWYFFAKNGIT